MAKHLVLALAGLALLGSTLQADGRTFHVNPETGKASNPGTAEKPWRTLEEVVTTGRLKDVEGGDTILLESGYHGLVRFAGDNDEVVTIQAAKGATPQLGRFEITRGSKWRIRGLTISSSFATEPVAGLLVDVADGGASREIVVEDCFVYTALDTAEWSAQDWMNANSGMFMGRHGEGLVFRNNYVLNTRFGISLAAVNSLCEGNVVNHFSGDGIRVTRDGITLRHNVIRNVYVGPDDGDKNHDDAIQCFLFNKGTGTVRNVTVTENLIHMREDPEQPWPSPHVQAIGFFDGPLIDFLVQGNVINTSHWHGVSLYDAQNCRILDNVAYTQWTDLKPRPLVQLGSKDKGPVEGNEVANNYAYGFRLEKDQSVRESNNKTVTKRIYKTRAKELQRKIEKAFGKIHPVAGLGRVGPDKKRK